MAPGSLLPWFCTALLVAACGGSTETDSDARGGGTSGGAGSGGASGNGSAGSGGKAIGSGGTGTGGTSVDAGTVCPSLPDCNWCNGAPLMDGAGCVVGYRCANGIDPCGSPPCSQGTCAAGLFCSADGLCLSAADCSEGCSVRTDSCACERACADNHRYQFICTTPPDGSTICDCMVDGVLLNGCAVSGGTSGRSCEVGISCCFGS